MSLVKCAGPAYHGRKRICPTGPTGLTGLTKPGTLFWLKHSPRAYCKQAEQRVRNFHAQKRYEVQSQTIEEAKKSSKPLTTSYGSSPQAFLIKEKTVGVLQHQRFEQGEWWA